MKKLLLTTALIGSTLVAGNAIAQTTVTGNLNIAFKAIAVEPAASAGNTGRGFGNEQQINIQNKGKLNNGLDYAAGFSIENDGAQTGTLFNENVYIDFIAGNTTITLGVDHIQNSDRTTSTLVGGMEAGDMALGNSNAAGADQSIFLTSVGADPAQAYGIGLIQTIPSFGKISALYVPTNSATLQTGTAGDKSFVEGDSSAVELGFVGDLGVKGLNIHLFRNEASKVSSAQANKLTGENYGISYNFGQVTLGYDLKKTGAITANADITQDGFGVAYAVNPQITVAANYTRAEKQGTATDAEARSVSLGYNLGAVSIIASYSNIENILGTAGADRDVIYLAARTSF